MSENPESCHPPGATHKQNSFNLNGLRPRRFVVLATTLVFVVAATGCSRGGGDETAQKQSGTQVATTAQGKGGGAGKARGKARGKGGGGKGGGQGKGGGKAQGKSGGQHAGAGRGGGQHKGGGRGAWGGGARSQQPAVPVAIEVARVGDIASYYAATATLTAEKEAEVMARVTGVVRELHSEEGDWVKEGQTLLRIDDSEYTLRVTQTEATTANLRDRYERLRGMWEQKLVSAEEFEVGKNAFKSAEAAEQLARLTLSYATVKAPFTGRVVSRMVDQGQNVSNGSALFRIADFDPLLAIVYVPSKEFKKLKPEQTVKILLDSNAQQLSGRIKLISPIIDPTSGTIKVTIEIPEYPTDTRPGDFAEVSIVTERRSGCTLVPKEAVFTDRGDQVVYVAADSTAERRVVEVGFKDGENAEILGGVDDGERIIVKGQRSLKHGQAIKVLEENVIPPPSEQAGS